MPGQRRTLQVDPFPPELRERLKINAIKLNMTMSDATQQAITAWCEAAEDALAGFGPDTRGTGTEVTRNAAS